MRGIEWSHSIKKCSQNLAFARVARKITRVLACSCSQNFWNCSRAAFSLTCARLLEISSILLCSYFLYINNYVLCYIIIWCQTAACETRLLKITLITTLGRLCFTGSGKFLNEMLFQLFQSKTKGLAKRGYMSRNYVSMSRGNTKCKKSSRKALAKVESNLEKCYYYQFYLTFRATIRAFQICTAVIG